MQLFHVSEQADIGVFHPRLPTRADLDPHVGLVWTVDQRHLSNFLTPRNCPRVGWHVTDSTTEADRRRFFGTADALHAIAVEQGWLAAMRSTTLYLYEFCPDGFTLQDAAAGYYVSTTPQTPIAVHRIDDPLAALADRGVEIHILPQLWQTADAVQHSTLDWSLCRMAFALPRPAAAEQAGPCQMAP